MNNQKITETEFRNMLQNKINFMDYNIYFSCSEIEIYEKEINIYMPNVFSKKQIETKYFSVIKALGNMISRDIFISVA